MTTAAHCLRAHTGCMLTVVRQSVQQTVEWTLLWKNSHSKAVVICGSMVVDFWRASVSSESWSWEVSGRHVAQFMW